MGSIHQLLMIGLQGPELGLREERLLSEYSPGAVILFNRNIKSAEQTAQLCARINELCETPPLIAADQEGGRVDRLRALLSVTLSPVDFQKCKELSIVRRFGELIARMLSAVGVNMNLAPVVDLEYSDTDNSLRGRCWGGEQDDVIDRAGAFLDGMQGEGVPGCLKHFPGLGRARVDSHHELPLVDISLEELRRKDLFPFAKLADRAPAAMIAHCCYKALGDSLPASLSPAAYKLMREEIGFGGLAISDDLEMGALSGFSLKERFETALNAGADMLPICNQKEAIEQAFSIIEEVTGDGSVPAARIDEAVARVMRIKEKLRLPPHSDEDPAGRIAALDGQLKALRMEVTGEREV
jgi:beta-N-acetylhexosaminidase